MMDFIGRLKGWSFYFVLIYNIGKLYVNGDIHVGEFSMLCWYTWDMTMIFDRINDRKSRIEHKVYELVPILNMMRSEPDIKTKTGKKVKNLKGVIEFKNVTFKYPTRPDVKVLKNFDLKINEGEMVAFCGESGCGKTTTIKLVLRNYDVSEGSLEIDGTNITELNLQSLHRKVGVVSQEPSLMKATLEENITYGVDKGEYTQADLVAACKDANAYDFIMDVNKFPKGFQTKIDEGGGNLSGGQKQRIAIARALIKKPKILILDEATSSLDTKAEREVKDAIDQIIEKHNLTVLVVAHRLSTVMDAHRILMMDKGEIIE